MSNAVRRLNQMHQYTKFDTIHRFLPTARAREPIQRQETTQGQILEDIALIKTVELEKRMTQTYIVLVAVNADVFGEKDEMNNPVRLTYIRFVLLVILSFDNGLR